MLAAGRGGVLCWSDLWSFPVWSPLESSSPAHCIRLSQLALSSLSCPGRMTWRCFGCSPRRQWVVFIVDEMLESGSVCGVVKGENVLFVAEFDGCPGFMWAWPVLQVVPRVPLCAGGFLYDSTFLLEKGTGSTHDEPLTHGANVVSDPFWRPLALWVLR